MQFVRSFFVGITVHVHELEASFCSAFKGCLVEENLMTTSIHDFQINVIGAVFSVNDNKQSFSKSAVFVDQSLFAADLLENTTTTLSSASQIVDSDGVYLSKSQTSLTNQTRKSLHDIFGRTRALCSSKFTPYSVHPSLIPNYIYLVSTFPRNGAAGKIDRKKLVTMAKRKIQGQMLKREKRHNLTSYSIVESNGKQNMVAFIVP